MTRAKQRIQQSNGVVIMRFRALAAVSALTALTLVGIVPAAQAADPPAPATGVVVKVEKLSPEQARTVDAASAARTAFSPETQGRVLCFQAHARTAGWTAVVCSNEAGFTGTEAKNDPIDAVRFIVGTVGALNFNVQTHWANDGTASEDYVPPGYMLEISNANGNVLEAIRLRSTNETMKAAAHVQNVGWKGTGQWSYDQWIGSIGEGHWMEAFWVDI
ncbi:hypothetical protein [Kitasatospora sp. NPDC050463]|uniref:hypothetical protein n=1 Tax=Kitasatospora sp. NPDC050463 TaxID=3155786 RepID=UPI0033D32129